MTALPQHVPGRTWHGRRAEGVANSFAYDVDYVLLDPDALPPPLRLFSRGRRTLAALRDRDHGGPPGGGRGAAWAREVLVEAGLEPAPTRLLLLAQPRILGQVFNPVSFWLAYDAADALRAVIAEVTNTYGDRHSYLCHADDFSPITPRTGMAARKVLHVSPFQPVAGDYAFRFDIRPETIDIRIHYASDAGRLVATLAGPRLPLTDRAVLGMGLRLGGRRVLGLIHWQAFKLWWKGARFRGRPAPPAVETSAPSPRE